VTSAVWADRSCHGEIDSGSVLDRLHRVDVDYGGHGLFRGFAVRTGARRAAAGIRRLLADGDHRVLRHAGEQIRAQRADHEQRGEADRCGLAEQRQSFREGPQ
jgi:hypothetical protein